MSVLHKKTKKSESAAIEQLQKEIDALKAAAEQAAAFSVQSFSLAVISDRAAGLNLIDDGEILQAEAYHAFPAWEDNRAYKKGEIITYNGLTYEVIAAHTSNGTAYPVETTFAYYRLVELEHAGTLEDPIPYPETAGILVNVENGKYYSYKGSVYQAQADMPNCVYPPDTPGMWQWSKIDT